MNHNDSTNDIQSIFNSVGKNEITINKNLLKDHLIIAFTDIICELFSQTYNIPKIILKNKFYEKFNEYCILDNNIEDYNELKIKEKILSIFSNDLLMIDMDNTTNLTVTNYPNINSKSLDNYEIIGSGSFANVYKIYNYLDCNYYALKKIGIKSSNFKQILFEVKSMAKLNHPNIVRYYMSWIESSDDNNKIDCAYQLSDDSSLIKINSNLSLSDESWKGSLPGCSIDSSYDESIYNKFICIQMEMCKNTLKKFLLENKNKLSIEYKKIIIKQIVYGLKYIHEQNIIHRDLKLQNIFISHDNNIKIGDFGLAINIYDVKYEEVGTYGYIAPEIFNGETHTIKTDLYSLGVIMSEIIFEFSTNMEKILFMKNIDKYVTEDINVYEIIKSLLDNDPVKRFSLDTIINLLQ
jgi:translation initiation factor 2-alpha kinase 4